MEAAAIHPAGREAGRADRHRSEAIPFSCSRAMG